MWLITLGMKNLLRSPKRVALSLISVIAGVSVFIMGDSFANGLTENVVRAEIDSNSAHATIHPKDYDADAFTRPIDDAFLLTPEAIAYLDDEALVWTRRLSFSPEGIVGEGSLRLRGVAFQPETDEAVFPRTMWNVDGTIPEAAGDGILIGRIAAELLDVGPGDVLTLRTRTVDGAMNALIVPISGVLSAGNPLIDMNTIFIPWDETERLLLNHGRTTHVHARLANRNTSKAFVEGLSAHLPDNELETWQEATADIVALMAMRKTMFRIMSFALLAMAATGIANTILMAAYERVREIGTFRAMGMTRRQVTQLFLIEGAVLGTVGGLLGALIAGSASYYWSVHGIDLAPMIEATDNAKGGIGFSTMLYLAYSNTTVLIGFGIGVFVATAASVYPARAASQLSPADAVRA